MLFKSVLIKRRRLTMAVLLSSSYLRRSYQLLATLRPEGQDTDRSFEKSSDIVYQWARRKFTKIFHRMSFDKTTFSDKRDGNEIGVIYDSIKGKFIFRCAHPDVRIPGRMWITDVELLKRNSEYVFAVRLSVTSLQSCTEDVPFSRPTFVRKIIEEVGISDTIPLSGGAQELLDKEDVDDFLKLLENQNRRMPVILLTSCCKNEEGVCDGGYMLNPSELGKDLVGVAHVFYIGQDLNDYLTKRIGKTWSVFNGAIRTYYPGLSFEESDCFQHPLLTQQNIRLRDTLESNGANVCMHEIEDYVKNYVLVQRFPWEDNGIEFYLTAYQNLLSEQRNLSKQSRHQLVVSYEEQLSQLQKQCDENFALADSYAKDCEDCREENERQRKIIRQLKAQLEIFRYQLENTIGQTEKLVVPDDATYLGISEWIGRYYPDRLVLHPRAARSLKTAVYEDIKLVYKCLKLLATSYYEYRMGQIPYAKFLELCKKVDPGLDERGAITDTAAGMQGDTYYVQYHGKKQKLERHLAKGSNKDRRYCLRIYFFWDDQEQMVVIGDLPYHLDTSAT